MGAWDLETLESVIDTGNETSLVVDAAGTTHVAFRFGTDADVRYLKGTASAFAPSETVESANNVGNFVSLDIGSTGKAFIAHYDDTTDVLRFATNRAGFWQSTLVDSGGQVGTYASIDVLNAGLVFIGYRDDGQDDARVALNIGTTWQIFTIDAVGAPGQYASEGPQEWRLRASCVRFCSDFLGGVAAILPSQTCWWHVEKASEKSAQKRPGGPNRSSCGPSQSATARTTPSG